MAEEEGQVIECAKCGRLHEVAADEQADTVTCECGAELEVTVPEASAEDAVGAATDPDTGLPGFFATLRHHWKIVTLIFVVLIGVGVFFAFWHGPTRILAHFHLAGGPSVTGGDSAAEDPEVHLRTLADNARAGEHAHAAAMLLRMNHPAIVPGLCRMAAQPELLSRLLVVRLLGQMGDESALEVLGPLMTDADKELASAATVSVTRIGTPLAEAALRDMVRVPSRGREALGSIASARNDTAARVLGVCLDDPSLRSLTLDEIAKSRVTGCTDSLVRLARNRLVQQTDRMKSVETLGRLESVESRRALLQLTDDTQVGWKARQVLDELAHR